jgi:hypothetical protein
MSGWVGGVGVGMDGWVCGVDGWVGGWIDKYISK